jgi:hypothetical protein
VERRVQMGGGRIAGIIAIVLSLASGVVAILYYTGGHTRRGLVLVIAFGILLVLGILLVALTGRKSAAPAK